MEEKYLTNFLSNNNESDYKKMKMHQSAYDTQHNEEGGCKNYTDIKNVQIFK